MSPLSVRERIGLLKFLLRRVDNGLGFRDCRIRTPNVGFALQSQVGGACIEVMRV